MQLLTRGAEEDEIEGKAHPEGVDAATVGQQQAGPGAFTRKQGQSEQPRQRIARDGDLEPKHVRSRKAREAAGQLTVGWSRLQHGPSTPLLPLVPRGNPWRRSG